MLIVFCADPFDRRQPDAVYADEVASAQAAGFTQALISYEPLVDEDNVARAIR
jgi:hypothetical protein